MKFLHTSDWHLGASDGTRDLHNDQLFFIDEICRIVKENNVDAVLIAGDVYDRSVSSAEAIKLYDYAMSRLCIELGKQVLVIAGNHDSAERLSSCRDLLSSAGLHIAGELERNAGFVSISDTDFYLLPWISEEKVKSVFPECRDSIRSLEDAFRVVTDHMRESFIPGKRHVLLSHSYIANCTTSKSDRAAVIGFATQVPASVFEGFDYVALGHLHGPQNVNACIRYSGTPMPYSFGEEENQTKSVTIIDTADMRRTVVPLNLMHRRTTVTGTLKELLSPEIPEDIRTGYVNIVVTDRYVDSFTLSQLMAAYPLLTDWHGLAFTETGDSKTMSIEEFEKLEDDPAEIFRHYCADNLGMEQLDEHLVELFMTAIEEVANEATVS